MLEPAHLKKTIDDKLFSASLKDSHRTWVTECPLDISLSPTSLQEKLLFLQLSLVQMSFSPEDEVMAASIEGMEDENVCSTYKIH